MGNFACTQCGKEYETGIKFCSECGRKVGEKQAAPVFACSKCGKEYETGVKFCSECGGKVTDITTATATAAVPEKKQETAAVPEKKQNPALQRTPYDWVKEFFSETVKKHLGAGFFTRPPENFYYALNSDGRYAVTPQKIEKTLEAWGLQSKSVNPSNLIYLFNTEEVFNNKVAGGFFSTEGLSYIVNKNKSIFDISRKRIDIPWSEITDIKIINHESQPGPNSLSEVFTQNGSQMASDLKSIFASEGPKPWVIINRQHIISFYCRGNPTVCELQAFFNAIVGCKCEIIGDKE